MNDLPHRLRAFAFEAASRGDRVTASMAADEIERLRARERRIIDETWGEALEDGSVPSTKLQDKIIAAVDNQQQAREK